MSTKPPELCTKWVMCPETEQPCSTCPTNGIKCEASERGGTVDIQLDPYILIRSDALYILKAEVNKAIKQGYKLCGPPVVYDGEMVQALIFNAKE